MQKMRLGMMVSLALLGWSATWAQAGGWSVGVRVGGPVYYSRPYYGPGYYGPGPYYYRPYPVIVEPPVYYTPAPVVVQQPPVVLQSASPPALPPPGQPPTYDAPAPRPLGVQPVSTGANHGEVDRHLQLLGSAEESVRLDSVKQLGRCQDARAADSLAATLSGDRSVAVREAAARSLALIGSPRAMPALRQAALNDNDRDVRHSAQFAIDFIQNRSN